MTGAVRRALRSITLAVLACLFTAGPLQAQVSFHAVVKGRVIDDSTGTPLALTNVFVANSTIGSAANAEGKFVLKNVPFGTQQIVASIVGYSVETWTLRVTDSITYEVEFRLRPRPLQMPDVLVEAKDPVEWRKYLQRFCDSFFGTSPNSTYCRILNPQILDFQLDEQKNQFKAWTREPLQIENRALGYRFTYFLRRYIESPEIFQFMGITHFEELKPKDGEETARWKENRRKAYYGSKRHFITALIRKTWREDGFEINSIRKTPPRMALLWKSGSEVDADTLLKAGRAAFERRISFDGLLQVVYTQGRRREFSLMQLDQPVVTIYANGLIENPLRILTQGYWSGQRAADLLPTDYEPE
jgi:hypothetical protein